MHVPRLPDAILELHPGELVHYRWWCVKKNDWITDCAAHLVLEEPAEGVTLVLMGGKRRHIPTLLLKRIDDPISHFASLEEKEASAEA